METTTYWLRQVSAGNRQAADQLWRRYYERLVRHARSQLSRMSCHTVDGEDVALSAFHSFYRALEAGRHPDLHDRHGLWALLLTIVSRKVLMRRRHDRRLKRSPPPAADGDSYILQEIPSGEPNPAVVVEAIEVIRTTLNVLGNDNLRQLLLLKLQGYTNPEASEQMDCSVSTVERKLRLIRESMKQQLL